MKCPHCGAQNADEARFCGACGRATLATEPTAHPHAIPGAASPDLSGREIAGRYRIQTKLGEGGMGTVYRAEQMSLKRKVALKLLRPELSADPGLVRRFNAEAELVAKLSHPNTVNIYDFGQDADGTLFIAMEFIEGRSLREVMTSEGALPPARALAIAGQICAALADAHGHGIVHRDLKPDNVMLSERGRQADVVRVLDFGIAKLRDEQSNVTSMTRAGDLVGTPQYMAPEQIRGEAVDGRVDVYALGALIYEMITGRLPFEAPTVMALLSKHLTEEPLPPAQRRPDLPIPNAMDLLVVEMLRKDPARRPPSMERLAERLTEVTTRILSTRPSQLMNAISGAGPSAGALPPGGRPLGPPPGVPRTYPPGQLLAPPEGFAQPVPLASAMPIGQPVYAAATPYPGAPYPGAITPPSQAPAQQPMQYGQAPGTYPATTPAGPPYGTPPHAAGAMLGAPLTPVGMGGAQPAPPSRAGMWLGLGLVAVAAAAVAIYFGTRSSAPARGGAEHGGLTPPANGGHGDGDGDGDHPSGGDDHDPVYIPPEPPLVAEGQIYQHPIFGWQLVLPAGFAEKATGDPTTTAFMGDGGDGPVAAIVVGSGEIDASKLSDAELSAGVLQLIQHDGGIFQSQSVRTIHGVAHRGAIYDLVSEGARCEMITFPGTAVSARVVVCGGIANFDGTAALRTDVFANRFRLGEGPAAGQ